MQRPTADYLEVRPAIRLELFVMEYCVGRSGKNFLVINAEETGHGAMESCQCTYHDQGKRKKVPDWTTYNGDAGPLPYSNLKYTAK